MLSKRNKKLKRALSGSLVGHNPNSFVVYSAHDEGRAGGGELFLKTLVFNQWGDELDIMS